MLPLVADRIILVEVADIGIVHFRCELADADVATSATGTEMTQTTRRILAEGCPTTRAPGLVSECVELDGGESLCMIEFAVGTVRTIALEIEIVA